MDEREYSEECICRNLDFLRSTEKSSPFQRNKARKRIQLEMNFLRVYYPESECLSIDMSDVSFEKE